MPWTTPVPAYLATLWLVVTFLILWFRQPRGRLAILVLIAAWTLFNTALFYAVNWSQFNWYLRFFCYILPFAVFIRWVLRMKRMPWFPSWNSASGLVLLLSLVSLLPLSWLNSRILASRSFEIKEPAPLLVLVPVEGMWVVTNGGNSVDGWLMSDYQNPLFAPSHPEDPSMAYGVDFQEITIRGFLGQVGPRPANFQDYEGFASEVYAPCPGQVILVETGNPDKQVDAPAEGLGDKVVLQCFDVFITLGNMRAVLVKEGDPVSLHQMLGYVGNTGSPSLPHLHVHATTGSYLSDGIPVPLLFEYKFATRNLVFLR